MSARLWMVLLTLSAPATVGANPAAPAYHSLSDAVGARALRISQLAVDTSARPTYAGQRPQSVELLEDAMLRKHPKLLKNDPALARQVLQRRYVRSPGTLRGHVAEALFVERNDAWGYVRSPTATQHDVYRWLPNRRPPLTGQIKYHDGGDAALYARDMLRDHRAHRFFVPSDHLAPTRAYVSATARQLEAQGDAVGAARAWRNYGRLASAGYSSDVVRSTTTAAASYLARERAAAYLPLSFALALTIGSAATHGDRAELSQGLVLTAAGVAAERAMAASHRLSPLRSTVRGQGAIAAVMLATQAVWDAHVYGGVVFTRPQTQAELVGGVSGATLAIAAGSAASTTGNAWLVFAAATTAGVVGHIGGTAATTWILRMVRPELFREHEKLRLVIASRKLEVIARCLEQAVAPREEVSGTHAPREDGATCRNGPGPSAAPRLLERTLLEKAGTSSPAQAVGER